MDVSVVAGAMDDQRGPVGVMHDGAGDAAQQHRLYAREAPGTHDDRRCIVLPAISTIVLHTGPVAST